jgi:hypothetical protein
MIEWNDDLIVSSRCILRYQGRGSEDRSIVREAQQQMRSRRLSFVLRQQLRRIVYPDRDDRTS